MGIIVHKSMIADCGPFTMPLITVRFSLQLLCHVCSVEACLVTGSTIKCSLHTSNCPVKCLLMCYSSCLDHAFENLLSGFETGGLHL